MAHFLSQGNVNFPDEVLLGRALTKVMNTPKASKNEIFTEGIDVSKIRKVIDEAVGGYQSPEIIHGLFEIAGIPMVKDRVAISETEAVLAALDIGFPVFMKVVSPLHKTEVGGVVLNVRNVNEVRKEFHHLFQIEGTESVLIAQMASGIELFLGANYEDTYGHVVLCGMRGIYVEVLKDVASGLALLSHVEAASMIKGLKSYKILQ